MQIICAPMLVFCISMKDRSREKCTSPEILCKLVFYAFCQWYPQCTCAPRYARIINTETEAKPPDAARKQ